MFCRPSPLVAADPSWSAMRCLAIPSIGMKTTEPSGEQDAHERLVRPVARDERAGRLEPDVRREHEELEGDELLRAFLGRVGRTRGGR